MLKPWTSPLTFPIVLCLHRCLVGSLLAPRLELHVGQSKMCRSLEPLLYGIAVRSGKTVTLTAGRPPFFRLWSALGPTPTVVSRGLTCFSRYLEGRPPGLSVANDGSVSLLNLFLAWRQHARFSFDDLVSALSTHCFDRAGRRRFMMAQRVDSS